MENFLLNILASVLGGVVLLIAASVVSRRVRWVLTGLFGHILGVDIEYVYTDRAHAEADLRQELGKAREVAVFTSRGNEFQRGAFAPIFLDRSEHRRLKVRILLPQTILRADEYDWTAQRERELAEFDPAFGNRLLHRQIDANVEFLTPHVASGAVALRRYNAPHLGRIIATDRCVFYTPYERDAHGRDAKVYKFRRSGEMYDNLVRLFEQLWEADGPSEPIAEHANREAGRTTGEHPLTNG